MPRSGALFLSGGATATFAATVPSDLGTMATQNASSVTITGGAGAFGTLTLGAMPLRFSLIDNPASPYAANPFDDVWASTASAAKTVMLPASPSANTVIGAVRSGANALTIAANGNTINGTSADLVINQDKAGVWCAWDAALGTWQLTARTRS